jgi:hypothetical protein
LPRTQSRNTQDDILGRLTFGGIKGATTRLTAPAYWKFESGPLQRRVTCEPELRFSAPYFSKKTFPKGTGELAAFDLLDDRVEERMAMAIDGEIFQDAHLAPLGPDSEIYLIPKIGGG